MIKVLSLGVATLLSWSALAGECDDQLAATTALIAKENTDPDTTGERAAKIAAGLKYSDLALAKDYARRALALSPASGPFDVLLAELQVRDGEWDEGFNRLSDVLAREPYRDREDLQLLRLRWAWQAERFEDIVRWTKNKKLSSEVAGFRYAALIRLERSKEAFDAWAQVTPAYAQALNAAGWSARLIALTHGPIPGLAKLRVETRGTHPVLDENVDYILTKLTESDPAPALEALQAYARRRDWYLPLRDAQAVLLRKLGREVEAKLVLADPSLRVEQLQTQALQAKARGDLKLALRLIDEATLIKPNIFVLLKLKFDLLVTDGRADEAIRLLEVRRAERPEMRPVLTAFLGSIYFEQKNYDLCEATIDEALKLDANSAVANFIKAQLLRKRKPQDAYVFSARAFAANPKPKYERLMVMLLIDSGRLDEAAAVLNNSALPSTHGDVWARLHHARGDYRASLEALAREPRNVGRLVMMAKNHYRLGQVDLAYRSLSEALARSKARGDQLSFLTSLRYLEAKTKRADLRTPRVTAHLNALGSTEHDAVVRAAHGPFDRTFH